MLVTGARRWSDAHLLGLALCTVIVSLQLPPSEITVVHGDAEGADRMSGRLAVKLGMGVDPHPACWSVCSPECPSGHRRINRRNQEYCPDAGFRRDAEMVALLAPGEFCLAFALRWASGTGHCARRARAAGLQVVDWGVDTTPRVGRGREFR